MNYSSDLKTWGATGTEYPDGYSYKVDESPVDEWDNFQVHNIIQDIEHLIGVTNNDLVEKDNAEINSNLSLGEFGLVGGAGSVDFSGTEITVDGTTDFLQNVSVGGNIDINGDSVATESWVNGIPSSVDVTTSDPTSPEDGQTWIRSDL